MITTHPTPHATLEAAIGWSVDLLPDADRSMLLRLWPFEGGFPLEAVLSQEAGLETLSALVSRSMVVADTTTVPGRYRLLRSSGLLPRPRPGASSERPPTRPSSTGWPRRRPRNCGASGPRTPSGRSPASCPTSARRSPPDRKSRSGLRTAGLLEWFWTRRSLLEGSRLLERCLAAAPHAPARDIARARVAYASIEYVAGDGGHARETKAKVYRHDLQRATASVETSFPDSRNSPSKHAHARARLRNVVRSRLEPSCATRECAVVVAQLAAADVRERARLSSGSPGRCA